MSKYTIRRTSPTHTGELTQYLTERKDCFEFTTPGNTACGVGVANLKTWKTKRGAAQWMEDRPNFTAKQKELGNHLEVVPA